MIRKSAFVAVWFLFAATYVANAGQSLDPEKKALAQKVEKQLACDCGCSLTVADCRVSMTCSESAKLEKEVISYVKAGFDEPTILSKMREKYGETILAAPTKEGFNITAWTFPFLALALGGVIAFYYLKKWKTPEAPAAANKRTATKKADASPGSEYDQRVEDELKQFDA